MEKVKCIFKGNICYSKNRTEIACNEDSYLVCADGRSKGIYRTWEEIPGKYQSYEVKDCGDALIIPGLVDLHVHAPQYVFRGLGLDMELLEWLNTHTFPEESHYENPEYAKAAYQTFTENLKQSATTRAVIFATLHVPATELLMDMMEDTGLYTYIGKVNMDRNAPEYLQEESAGISAENTIKWLQDIQGKYQHTKPILTPRFIPSCSDDLMLKLKNIQKRYHLPLQSHLSENYGEIEWVKELCPTSKFYGDAYDAFGLFGGDCETIMAHCVHSGEEEQKLMKERGVYIAHCPESNMNLSSGVAPVKKYLEDGLRVGLGSDVAGGTTESIFRAMSYAIQASKLRWRLYDDTVKPLTEAEVFYMGTKGGGEFFGKVGSLEADYEFDALVIDDAKWNVPGKYNPKERIARLIYLADDDCIIGKYVAGEPIMEVTL